MDVDAVSFHGVSKDNSRDTRAAFNKVSGNQWSANEHLVPKNLLSIEGRPAHGISAVKALSIASAEGQKIWTIDASNLDNVLGKINLGSDIEQEIRHSVLAGNIATTHESVINYNGWIGAGYLLIDPDIGAGAYKIIVVVLLLQVLVMLCSGLLGWLN